LAVQHWRENIAPQPTTARTEAATGLLCKPWLTGPVDCSTQREDMVSITWLDVQQVANLLGVDPKTITRWSRSDPTMPVLRRGRVVRFRADLLDSWLESQLPRAARAKVKRTESTPTSQPTVTV